MIVRRPIHPRTHLCGSYGSDLTMQYTPLVQYQTDYLPPPWECKHAISCRLTVHNQPSLLFLNFTPLIVRPIRRLRGQSTSVPSLSPLTLGHRTRLRMLLHDMLHQGLAVYWDLFTKPRCLGKIHHSNLMNDRNSLSNRNGVCDIRASLSMLAKVPLHYCKPDIPWRYRPFSCPLPFPRIAAAVH